MDIILFGIQGSGKGTQGKFLAEKHGLTVFEMGGELRKMIQSGSALGNQIKSIVESGQLVSSEIIMQVVERFMNEHDAASPLLFDGIPRTFSQAQPLEALLQSRGRSFHGVLISISETEALKRLTQRRLCSVCKKIFAADYTLVSCDACGGALVTRSDDNAESIRQRLQNYAKETIPLIDDYRSRSLLTEVNGAQPIPQVTEELFRKTAPLFSR